MPNNHRSCTFIYFCFIIIIIFCLHFGVCFIRFVTSTLPTVQWLYQTLDGARQVEPEELTELQID